ncbi:hypothetical protein GCM10025762_54450 [Haloechinothrix salitolerans]
MDGFVIAASRMRDKAIKELASNHRLTLVSRQVSGVPSAIVDHVDGTRGARRRGGGRRDVRQRGHRRDRA